MQSWHTVHSDMIDMLLNTAASVIDNVVILAAIVA